MKVEVLYFDGYPTYKTAEKTLRKVLAEEGIDAEVELVASTPTRRPSGSGSPEARQSGWTGKRLDGQDLFPAPEREDWRQRGCRVYATLEGLEGTPTVERLREALMIREGAVDAGLHR